MKTERDKTMETEIYNDLLSALIEAQAALNGAPNTLGLHEQIEKAIARAKG